VIPLVLQALVVVVGEVLRWFIEMVTTMRVGGLTKASNTCTHRIIITRIGSSSMLSHIAIAILGIPQ
jgi:hypothetical protein